MSNVVIWGPPQSSYLRSARMACVERGVEHENKPLEFGSDDHRARHPYFKVPALEHGDTRLYETNAIVHYLDGLSDSGPRLVPEDAAQRALAEQWVSVLNCYAYQHLVRDYSFAYLRAPETGPDQERIQSAMEKVNTDLDLLEAQLKKTAFLAGDAISHADILFAPAVQTAAMFPEGKAALDARPRLAGWFKAISDRPSAKFLNPPPPG